MGQRLSLEMARTAAAAAFECAARDGLGVSVVVVDAWGRDVLVMRGDGAPWFTPGVARCKATTAATFGCDNATLSGLQQEYPDLMPLVDDQLPFRLTTLPGGVVIRRDGEVLGAIAVSGARPDQDVACAEAGRDACLGCQS